MTFMNPAKINTPTHTPLSQDKGVVTMALPSVDSQGVVNEIRTS